MKKNKIVLIAYAMLALVTLFGLACSPTPEGSETLNRIIPPSPFSEVLKRAVTTKQVPDDAVVNGDTSKLWRIIFDGLGAKARDALAFVYVSPSGDDSNEGSSWAKAKKTIGGALNGIADATDTKRYIVLIGAGTYNPSESLSLKNYVALIGGFEASNYERRGTTTISGEDTIQVFKNKNLDTLSTPSKKSTAVLAGVTIAKGTGESGGGMLNSSSSPTVVHTTFSRNKATGIYGAGGGMYNGSSSSPTVVHTTFSRNKASRWGGGMANRSSSPTVTNTTFSGNTATDTNSRGGGMYNVGSLPTVTNTTFSGNEANVGGGMYNESSSPTVTNTTFSGNTATDTNGSGGGMFNYKSSPTVSHTTFSGNTATGTNGRGGGMYNESSSPTVTNTTFSGNTATNSGGGMVNWDGSSPTVTNTTFSGNTATDTNGSGGGMFNYKSSPTVSHTTFSGNTATGTNGSGGGMFNESSSSPVISSSIFWGNTKGLAPDQIANYDSNSIPVVAHSIVQGDYAGGTSIIKQDPRLGPLADNGGFVKTMALKEKSSAINKGLYFARKGTTNYYSENGSTWYTKPTLSTGGPYSFPTGAVRDDTDARGYGHKDRPDIGAYEYEGTEP